MTTLASISDFFAWFSGPWMPEDGGGFTDNVDALNGFILVVCYFFSAVIAGLMVWFCIKYRQTDKAEVGQGATHSTSIEIAWTLPPLVIVLVIFAVGFTGFLDMSTPPQGGNAYEIRAVASKWDWTFYYPNGGQGKELYIPADRPVKLTLESQDVLHSLFVPAMRAKQDVVPGRFNVMWFEPDASAVSAEEPFKEYVLNCTEYCGQGHSQMNTTCVVVHPSAWEAKLEELKKFNPDGLPPVEYGKVVWESRGGCVQCHTIDGGSNTGPTWKDLYGKKSYAMAVGDAVPVVDDNYILESIRYPNNRMSVGFSGGGMSAYPASQITPGDARALIEFMKSISDNYDGPVLETFPEGYEGKVDVDEFEGGEGGTDAQGDAPAPETPEAPETDSAPAE